MYRVDYHGVTVFNITLDGFWKLNGSQLHFLEVEVNWDVDDRNIYSNTFPQKQGTIPDKGQWNSTMRVWFGIPIINEKYEILITGSSFEKKTLFVVDSFSRRWKCKI